jgi:hypothetical protein
MVRGVTLLDLRRSDTKVKTFYSFRGPVFWKKTRLVSASHRKFKGLIGSRNAHAYLASPEVAAASVLSGVISGTGVYEAPANHSGVDFWYGTGSPLTTESELGNVVEQLESLIDRVESSVSNDTSKATTKIIPGLAITSIHNHDSHEVKIPAVAHRH